MVTTSGHHEASVPTHVFAFDSSSQFREFLPGGSRNIAGYFHDTVRGNYLVIDQARGDGATNTTFHEYTHFLVRNRTSLVYPMWFDEGFAEYMGATQIEESRVVIGGVYDDRWNHGGWMSMREVLRTESVAGWAAIKQNMFYRQAWALVHYLMTEQLQGGDFPQRMSEYLKLCEVGTPADDAFEKAFGIPVAKLDRKIQKYLKNKLQGLIIPRQVFESGEPTVVQEVAGADVANSLGELAISVGKLDTAEALFRKAIAQNPENSRALAGLGDIHKFRGQQAKAEPYFLRAIEHGPDEPLNHLDYAEYLHEKARKESSTSDTRRKLYKQARAHYVKAWKLDPKAPEVYLMYGKTFLEVGDSPEKALQMLEESHALLPGDLGLRFILAKAYVDQGRKAEARPLLKSVAAWSHRESLASAAQEMLSNLPPR